MIFVSIVLGIKSLRTTCMHSRIHTYMYNIHNIAEQWYANVECHVGLHLLYLTHVLKSWSILTTTGRPEHSPVAPAAGSGTNMVMLVAHPLWIEICGGTSFYISISSLHNTILHSPLCWSSFLWFTRIKFIFRLRRGLLLCVRVTFALRLRLNRYMDW